MASLHLANEIFKLIYPVGSIYLSDNATNPSSKFGGTWVQLKDHFLYAGSSFSSGNGTGTATNNHTLNINQIPSHDHGGSVGTAWSNFMRVVGAAGTGIDTNHTVGYSSASYTDANGGNIPMANHQHNISKQGGGEGHAHNIPYQSIYVWRRTA